jgi:hypothetical protein
VEEQHVLRVVVVVDVVSELVAEGEVPKGHLASFRS